ncbi:MAG: hypothetical protein MJA29_07435 [Candidatus Omnitrophica bacterium]|nr:hypothetical protein [Candidatus Omnitrophota bacterium]
MDRKIEETVDGNETSKAAIRQLKNEIKKGEEEMKINRREMVGMINEIDDIFNQEAEDLINIWFELSLLSLFLTSYYKFFR